MEGISKLLFKEKHSVIVHFTYFKGTLDPLHELETRLEEIINQKNVGTYDGREIAIDDSDSSSTCTE